MRRIVPAILIFLLIAFATQRAVIKYLPAVVYRIALHRSNSAVNTWINAPKTDATMRKVVLPNPDFVYSALFYDVRKQAIDISGTLPDSTYASISFYDNRCQPYFVYNNIDTAHAGSFNLHLSSGDKMEGNNVNAKSKRGVIICRFLKSNDSSYAQLVNFQKLLHCDVK